MPVGVSYTIGGFSRPRREAISFGSVVSVEVFTVAQAYSLHSRNTPTTATRNAKNRRHSNIRGRYFRRPGTWIFSCSLRLIQGGAQIAGLARYILLGRPEPERAPYIPSIRQRLAVEVLIRHLYLMMLRGEERSCRVRGCQGIRRGH